MKNKSQKFQRHYLPLDSINVIIQPRKTFEEINELADNIAENGILNPPVILCLNKEKCAEYLQTINFVWKIEYSPKDLISSKYEGEIVYFILIAGERRFRACKILFEQGCSLCREKGKEVIYGKCFKKHFNRSTIEVRLCIGIKPIDALYLQLAENTHFRVPPQEEAHAFEIVFSAEKKKNPKFSTSQFARRVGRSPETIRKSLRYCELPVFIQEEVENGIIKYGLALELGRLQDCGLDEDSLNFWLLRAVMNRNDIKHFRKIVDTYLFEKNSGQITMAFGLEDVHTIDNLKRRVVAPEMVNSVWVMISYLKKVERLFEENRLGKKESIFSEDSPNKIFTEMVGLSHSIMPFFEKTLSKSKYKKVQAEMNVIREKSLLN